MIHTNTHHSFMEVLSEEIKIVPNLSKCPLNGGKFNTPHIKEKVVKELAVGKSQNSIASEIGLNQPQVSRWRIKEDIRALTRVFTLLTASGTTSNNHLCTERGNKVAAQAVAESLQRLGESDKWNNSSLYNY